MKNIIIYFSLILSSISFSFAQQKPSGQVETMIGLYFKPYSAEPKYQINTMGEAMVKRTNEMGMWTHPSIARIMKQVKTYQSLNFNGTPENLQKIVNQIDAAVKKNKVYQEYFRWEMNNTVSSVIYTRGDKKIIELDYITISKGHISVSCFVGDDIDMESIRSLVANK